MTVPLSTIKAALKIGYDDDDADLIRLREAAWSLVERETGLLLSPATRTQYLARWAPTALANLPFSSVSSVTYRDGTNTLTTMPATDYFVDRSDGPIPILRFLEIPEIYDGTNIEVATVCGYQEVPNELVHCIIALVGGWYNNPEAFQPVGLNPVPLSVEFILGSYRQRGYLR